MIKSRPQGGPLMSTGIRRICHICVNTGLFHMTMTQYVRCDQLELIKHPSHISGAQCDVQEVA